MKSSRTKIWRKIKYFEKSYKQPNLAYFNHQGLFYSDRLRNLIHIYTFYLVVSEEFLAHGLIEND